MKVPVVVFFTCIILNVKLMNARPQASKEQASKAAVEAKDRALFAARTANKIITEAGTRTLSSNDLVVGALLANVARAAASAAEVAAKTASGDQFSAIQVVDVFRQAAALAQIAESNVDALIRSLVEPGTKVLSGLLSRGNEPILGTQTQNSIIPIPDFKVESILRSAVEPGTKVLSGLLSTGNEPILGTQTENSIIPIIPDFRVGSLLRSAVEPGTKAFSELLSRGNVPFVGTGIGTSVAQVVNTDVGAPIRSAVEPGTKALFDLLSKVNLPVVEAKIGNSYIRVPDSNVGALIGSPVAGTNILSGLFPTTNIPTRTEDGNSLASGSLTTAMRTIVEAAKRATIAASAVSDLTRAKTKAEAESKVAAVEQAAVDAENFAQQAGATATTAGIIPGTEITSNIALLVANAFAAAARALAETAVTFVSRLRIAT